MIALLTVKDVAARLNVTTARVRFLVAAGRLKAERFGARTLLVDPRALARLHIGPVGRPRTRPVKAEAAQDPAPVTEQPQTPAEAGEGEPQHETV